MCNDRLLYIDKLKALAYLVLLVTLFPRINQLPLVLEYALALMAIAALVALFSHFSDSRTFLDRQLLLIGNSTLDIYICILFLPVFLTITYHSLTIFLFFDIRIKYLITIKLS